MTFGQKPFQVIPPEKGAFPLDHAGIGLFLYSEMSFINDFFNNILYHVYKCLCMMNKHYRKHLMKYV